mgnify:CR=1 FL=1
MPAPRCSPRSTPGMPAAVGSPDWRPPRCLPGPSSCPAREGSGNAATERTGTNRPAGGQGHRVTSQTRPSPHVRLSTHGPRPRRTRRQPPIPLTTCASSPPLGSPLWPLTRTATHLRHALRLTPCTHPNPPPHDGHLSPRANRASPPQGITGPTSARRAPVSPLEPRLTPCPHPGPLRRTCTSVPGRTALPFPHEVPPSARHRPSQEHRPKRPRANNQRTRLRPVGDAPQAQTPAGLSVLVEGLAGPSRPNDGLGEPNHRLDRTMNSHPAGAPYRRRPHHLAFASGLGPRRANEHGASWTCR